MRAEANRARIGLDVVIGDTDDDGLEARDRRNQRDVGVLDGCEAIGPVRPRMRPCDQDGGLGLPLGGETGGLRHEVGTQRNMAQRMGGFGPISSAPVRVATASTTLFFSK